MKQRDYSEMKPLLQELSVIKRQLDNKDISYNEYVKLKNKAVKNWKKDR